MANKIFAMNGSSKSIEHGQQEANGRKAGRMLMCAIHIYYICTIAAKDVAAARDTMPLMAAKK